MISFIKKWYLFIRGPKYRVGDVFTRWHGTQEISGFRFKSTPDPGWYYTLNDNRGLEFSEKLIKEYMKGRY